MPPRNKGNGPRGAKRARTAGQTSPTLSVRRAEEEIAGGEGSDRSEQTERRRRPRDARRSPRTATGKRSDPKLMAEAALEAQEYLRERTEAGHRAAGRTPPSEKAETRASGATRIIDDSIRSYFGPVTEDEKLLQASTEVADFTRTDPWRVLRIMGEFIEGFDKIGRASCRERD